MFVGDNLNAYGQWMKKHTPWGDPSKPAMTYWKRVWPLLKQGGVSTSKAFCTNFYVGLMEGDNPSAPFRGAKDLSLSRWCAAFLIEQIQTMRVGLVVALGVKSWQALDRWNVARRAGVDDKIIQLSHPSVRISKSTGEASRSLRPPLIDDKVAYRHLAQLKIPVAIGMSRAVTPAPQS